MRSEWPSVPLRDLCDEVQYGFTASSTAEPVGPKFLRITDIVPDVVAWSDVPYCEIDPEKLGKYLLSTGDIVVARTGATVGYSKLIRQPPLSVFASYLVRFRVSEAHDARYVGAVVESDSYKEYVKTHAGGAAQPNANAQVLGSFPVPLPRIEIQRKIAAVLAAYDELIENNLRRIEILEEMAQAVYREWFVNFRYPGHENVPLVDSAIGPIPAGWKIGMFVDLAENIRENVNPSKTPDEEFDHFSFAAFDAGRLPSVESGNSMKSGKLLVEQPSVLLAKLNPRIPRVWFARPGGERRSIASSEFLVLNSVGNVPLELVYGICSDLGFQASLATMSSGTSTSHQRLKLEDLLRQPQVVPTQSILDSFSELVGPMHRLQESLRAQNANLRSTRDLLLPKLVSGEIDVSELAIDTEWLAS